jgi:hypothetical protein
MGLFNLRADPSTAAPSYLQSEPVKPTALQTAGTLADLLLTGGVFHALNQRAINQQVQAQQRQAYGEMAGMFRPPTQTASPATDPASVDQQLLAAGKVGIPSEAFGGPNIQQSPGHVPSAEEFAPTAARAVAMGADPSKFLEMIKAAEPSIQYVNGVAVDMHDRNSIGKRVGVNLSNVNNRMVDTQNPDNANLTVPQVDKGQVVNYDARGVPIGVANLPGNAEAQAQVAGSVTGAQERNKAAYDLVDVPMPNGSTIKMPRLRAVNSLTGAAPGGPGATGGLGVSQAPGDKAYDEDAGKAEAGRFQSYVNAGTQAPAKIAQYQQIDKLLGDFEGGRLGPAQRGNGLRAE